jgi:hypothetical protein
MHQQRRKRFKTSELAALAHPYPLQEVLQDLIVRGDLEWYELGKYRTTIKLTKTTDISTIFKEATKAVINPRPYVANKTPNWKRTKN